MNPWHFQQSKDKYKDRIELVDHLKFKAKNYFLTFSKVERQGIKTEQGKWVKNTDIEIKKEIKDPNYNALAHIK